MHVYSTKRINTSTRASNAIITIERAFGLRSIKRVESLGGFSIDRIRAFSRLIFLGHESMYVAVTWSHHDNTRQTTTASTAPIENKTIDLLAPKRGSFNDILNKRSPDDRYGEERGQHGHQTTPATDSHGAQAALDG